MEILQEQIIERIGLQADGASATSFGDSSAVTYINTGYVTGNTATANVLVPESLIF
jgi:hypothetical protein